MKEICEKEKIELDVSPPDTQQLNGLPANLWHLAVDAATYVLNRTCHKGINFEIPLNKFDPREKSGLKYISRFGCLAYRKILNKSDLKKFSTRTYSQEKSSKNKDSLKRYFLVGYSSNSYKLLDIQSGEIINTRDVRLRPSVVYKDVCDEIKSSAIPTVDETINYDEWFSNANAELEILKQTSLNKPFTRSEARKLEIQQNLIALAKFDDKGDVFALINNDPVTYSEAISREDGKEWLEAIEEEKSSMVENDVWDIVRRDELEPGTKILSHRWVFHEPVYMEVPEGVLSDDVRGEYVCKLKKSLYGLKISPKKWNERLESEIREIGLENTLNEPCLFTFHQDGIIAVIVIYVDDLIVASNNAEKMKEIVDKLSSNFKISDLGELKKYLGINIIRDKKNKVMTLDQREYVDKILERFEMSNCKSVKTPMVERGVMNKELKALEESEEGSERTRDYSLRYEGKCDELEVYADASFRDVQPSMKTTEGYIIKLFGDVISWAARKRKRRVTSTCEAEFRALNEALREMKCLQSTIKGVMNRYLYPVVAYCDSDSAVKCTTVTSKPKLKHVIETEAQLMSSRGRGRGRGRGQGQDQGGDPDLITTILRQQTEILRALQGNPSGTISIKTDYKLTSDMRFDVWYDSFSSELSALDLLDIIQTNIIPNRNYTSNEIVIRKNKVRHILINRIDTSYHNKIVNIRDPLEALTKIKEFRKAEINSTSSTLQKQLEDLRFNKGSESVAEFILRFEAAVQKFEMLCKPLENDAKCNRFIIAVREQYSLYELTAETRFIQSNYDELMKLCLWFESNEKEKQVLVTEPASAFRFGDDRGGVSQGQNSRGGRGFGGRGHRGGGRGFGAGRGNRGNRSNRGSGVGRGTGRGNGYGNGYGNFSNYGNFPTRGGFQHRGRFQNPRHSSEERRTDYCFNCGANKHRASECFIEPGSGIRFCYKCHKYAQHISSSCPLATRALHEVRLTNETSTSNEISTSGQSGVVLAAGVEQMRSEIGKSKITFVADCGASEHLIRDCDILKNKRDRQVSLRGASEDVHVDITQS
ncbi:unnamed protein product, partial [Allacma fusca]